FIEALHICFIETLFSFQRSTHQLSTTDNFYIISSHHIFVNNFLIYFFTDYFDISFIIVSKPPLFVNKKLFFICRHLNDK
ncbi:hypothetical protein FYL10_04180, partial [Lactobacillus salivarius]|nr:hypothetical protein [Ligilactobacillus salivarius]MYY58434.1 hypothetical protein [Ligilactobacillus salivarius]MYY72881.1 hypothetical protein [Ligilactobacillus salivarius]MYZ22963.1 hypothetical protein [Ligilactobacillus salivarius]